MKALRIEFYNKYKTYIYQIILYFCVFIVLYEMKICNFIEYK